MSLVKSILMRAFGHPTGILGRLGGMIMAHLNQRMYQRTIELLDIQPSDKVLEIGFGPGVGIQLLAGSVSSGWIAGIDLSEEMVEMAKTRNAHSLETGKVELRQGSVESLPFENATFDKALSINSLQIWPDAIAGLREIWRTLKPGGKIVLGFTRHSGQSREGLTEKLTTAGFAEAHVVDVDGDFCVLAVKR
jgi:ubiquinone/menaquinone biosynthesis C-methylase UbiE